jgi:predicted nucleic acid-binding protein
VIHVIGCTVDANVFVAAARRSEARSSASRQFLVAILRRRVPLFCPNLVLPEVAAAIARPTGDEGLGLTAARRVRGIHSLRLVDLDEALATDAMRLAALLRLRGADAVYLATAQSHGATLVTWDNEMLQRGPVVAPTITPSDWLQRPTM